MFIYARLDQIDDNPFQARQEYGDVDELAADIMRQAAARPDTHGLQQIPTARLVGDDDGLLIPIAGLDKADYIDGDKLRTGWRVQLEFGHRRKRAFDYLFKKGVAQYFYMPLDLRDLDDNQMLDGVWQENRSRRDLSAVEEAELLSSKLARSTSQREVAEAWGIDRSTVANRLRLLKLPPAVQEANRTGLLSERQCLSLATIATLPDMVDQDEFQWGTNNSGESWHGKPMSPDSYVQYVVDNPATTSEKIRDMTKLILDHVGATIPSAIPAFDSTLAASYTEDEITQPLCKGCPLRVNQTCLDESCLKTKKIWFAEVTLAEAAAELNLPISHNEDHFALFENYKDRQRLQKYWDAGNREGLVVGWRRGSALRPFTDSDYVQNSTDIFGDNSRAAIVIGSETGGIPGGENPKADIASNLMVDAWSKQASKILTETRKRAKEAMKEALAESISDYQPLIALMQKPDAETTDDQSELNNALLEFLWNRGLWMQYTPSTAVEHIQAIEGMFKRAGISSAALRPPKALHLSQQAVLWLDFWYYYRNHYYEKHKRHAAAQAAINDLRDQFAKTGNLDNAMFDLSLELDRAARDIASKLAE